MLSFEELHPFFRRIDGKCTIKSPESLNLRKPQGRNSHKTSEQIYVIYYRSSSSFAHTCAMAFQDVSVHGSPKFPVVYFFRFQGQLFCCSKLVFQIITADVRSVLTSCIRKVDLYQTKLSLLNAITMRIQQQRCYIGAQQALHV